MDLEQVAQKVMSGNPFWHEIGNLQSYVRTCFSTRLSPKQSSELRVVLARLQQEKDDQEERVKVVIVLSARNGDPFTPQHISAFRDTPKGVKLAEKTFREWVEEAVDDIINPNV